MKRSRLIYFLLCFIFLGSGIQQSRAGVFTASGSTLTLDLNVASQLVTVVSTGTTYTFTLSGGATNTWTGTTDANVTVSGVLLTVTATGLSTFSTINITDSQTGNAVTFNTSGTNAYSDNINVTLDNTPGAVTFNGTSSFSGTNALNVTTSKYITFASASGLSTVDGNLTLDANTQATPNDFAFSGIAVNAATVQVTGTGVLSMRARGGSTGASTSFLNKGIVVYAGGQVKGGTTGTATFEGWGYTGLSGTIQAQGVVVNGTGTLGTSTISSNGANVSVTGYGSNTTAAAVVSQLNAGVVVGAVTPSALSNLGIISSGGSGAVVVKGYGGTCANPASVLATYSIGVYVAGSTTTASASITSGGDLTVTGIGGGPDSLSDNSTGVYVNKGSIISGTNGNLVVTGTAGNVKSGGAQGNHGVNVTSGGQIKAGAGTGTTLVTGTGGGLLASGANHGVFLQYIGIISSLGSGSVTVIGYGGNLNGTGTSNSGVYLTSSGSIITSNGGNVSVEGTAGGGPTSSLNRGVYMSNGPVISAGGSGTVTVIGRGGNINGISGDNNYGVELTPSNPGQSIAGITSSGGNVTVTGIGGGGSSGSASASSSASNYGVYTELGGYITAGGTGDVTVTGTGGNSSTGATGANNYGVFVGPFAIKGTTELYSTSITSGGGNIIINGTGGGNGASASNYGVYNKGLIKATGAGTVSVTGTGGNTSGINNYGVFLDGAVTVLSVLYPATISSEGGNVTVTGTGGTVASGSSSGNAHGVYLNGSTGTGGGGSIITAGGSGNVTVTGYGGQNLTTSGGQNYGVYVNTGLSPNFSTITSSGGNVTVTGTGGGGSGASASSSTANNGVYLLASGSITAGANGTVTVTGNGGNNSTGGTGGTNYGVQINGGTTPYFSKISSNNGAVTVTGNGGGRGGSSADNNGVNVTTAGQITSAGASTPVTVNGTGGASSGNTNHGIRIYGTNSIITSGGGNVDINGTEGSSATSLALILASSGAISTATNGGNITITGNSFGSVAGTSIAAKSDGVVNIFPKTSGTQVSFASTTDDRGSIYINTAELATITGGTINIGNSSTGNIIINQAVIVPTGSNLNLATSSSYEGLVPKVNGTEITMAAGKALGLSGIPLLNIIIIGTTVNAQYDQLKVVGDVTLTGMSLSLSGTYTPTGGEVFTIVDATNVTGTFTGLANGATVTFKGVNLTVNYTATNVTLTASSASCSNPTTGGTITADQSGTTPFDPAGFTSTSAASGETGTLEYKWQSSTTSSSAGFTDISSSNTDTYDAGSLSVTTWYKRLARVSCSADWTGAAESNVLEVTVSGGTPCVNPTGAGVIAAAQSGTTPFDPAAFTSSSAASGETGTLEYKWQSSTTSSSAGFTDISSSNAATYDAGSITVTTWYKRLARVSCSADWTGAVASNVLEVTVSGGGGTTKISGKIGWRTDLTVGILNTSVALIGAGTGTVTTLADGLYSFDVTGSNYEVTPTKATSKLNGVTALDVTRISQHVGGTLPFTNPLDFIAADINKSNTLNTTDVSTLQNALLNNPISLSQFKNSWRFVPTNTMFSTPYGSTAFWSFAEKRTYTGITMSQTNQDFNAVKVGDLVTPSVNPALKPAPAVPVVFAVPDVSLTAGAMVEVPFRCEHFEDLVALQACFWFNPSVLALDAVLPSANMPIQAGNFGTWELAEGRLRLVWAVATAETKGGNPELFKLRFRVLQGGYSLGDVLSISQKDMVASAWHTDYRPERVTLAYTPVTEAQQREETSTEGVGFELYQNEPNPFEDKTVIGFQLPTAAAATLTVYDAAGRVLFTQQGDYAKGYNAMVLDRSLLKTAGVMYYTLETATTSATKKMIQMK